MGGVNVLGIETSSPVTSVVLWRDGEPAGREVSDRPRDHVEFLMPAIARLVGGPLAQLDAVAVGIGPGLFTSLRVGVATAKSLATTLGIGLVGVGSLAALARPSLGDAEDVVACVNAHRGEVYSLRFRSGRVVDEPRATSPATLSADLPADALLVGNGAAAYPDDLGAFRAIEAVPDADDVVALALPRLAIPDLDDALRLEPLYVRRSDAEIKWDEQGVVIERPMRVKIPKERP